MRSRYAAATSRMPTQMQPAMIAARLPLGGHSVHLPNQGGMGRGENDEKEDADDDRPRDPWARAHRPIAFGRVYIRRRRTRSNATGTGASAGASEGSRRWLVVVGEGALAAVTPAAIDQAGYLLLAAGLPRLAAVAILAARPAQRQRAENTRAKDGRLSDARSFSPCGARKREGRALWRESEIGEEGESALQIGACM